ncbi:MAG TPA: hypothetical protein VF647_02810 [Longimicrobium sp.]|jgi:hypothetical protein
MEQVTLGRVASVLRHEGTQDGHLMKRTPPRVGSAGKPTMQQVNDLVGGLQRPRVYSHQGDMHEIVRPVCSRSAPMSVLLPDFACDQHQRFQRVE